MVSENFFKIFFAILGTRKIGLADRTTGNGLTFVVTSNHRYWCVKLLLCEIALFDDYAKGLETYGRSKNLC